jgi:hypothetical protein
VTEIDHIVITAPDLAAGVELVRGALGVALEAGGQHARMGTHNCLLRLGNSLYLEVIAPDPRAAKPARPRWFQLDENASPRLAAWVARTSDIRATVAASTESLGEIEPMSRGDLGWLITIPADGSLPLDGAAPALIEWKTGQHPAARLPDAGCSLLRLEIFHPQPARISALLESISLGGDVSAGERPRLVAHFQTPNGPRELAG